MRKHFNHILMLMMSAMVAMVSTVQVFAADVNVYENPFETEPAVDTIVLDNDVIGDSQVHVDLSWKTKQDKGQWIEELGIGDEVSSLVLVINNLDKEDSEAIPTQEAKEEAKKKIQAGQKIKKPADITGKSRLIYFSKNENGEWEEFFSTEGFVSGDELHGKEITYGIYTPDTAFGVKENPGSLISYKSLTSNDYWCLNPADELFGSILTVENQVDRPSSAIRLESLKTFCNYGMILKAETEESGYPALVMNCLQLENNDGTFCGMQIPEQYMRMLIQSLDDNSRVIITDSLESLSDLENNI